MLPILAAILLSGIALTVLGLRGRRIDDHPLCRKCGFDLTGRSADSTRCPECGVDLERSRAVVVGHRRHLRVLLGFGIGIILPAVVVLFGVLWNRKYPVNWLRYAPMFYLLGHATSTDSSVRGPALTELAVRGTDGRLNAAAWDRAADAGLAYQADLTKPWDTAWGQWIEDSRTFGHLSDERWRRYAAGSWPGTAVFRVRNRVRRGDPVPYTIDDMPGRVGPHCPFTCWRSTRGAPPFDRRISWVDQPTYAPDLNIWFGPFDLTSQYSMAFKGGSLSASSYHGRPTGLQHLHFTEVVRVCSPGGAPGEAPLAEGTIDLPATFDLLPADQPSVHLIHDPRLAERVRQSVAGIAWRRYKTETYVSVHLNCPPVGVGFSIQASCGMQSFDVGTLSYPAGTNIGIVHWFKGLPGGSTIDVILNPDPAAAAGTLDTFDIWNGQIAVRKIAVSR